MPTQPRRRCIGLDGIGGSGKTTQAEHLTSWLTRRGYRVAAPTEYGPSTLGEYLARSVRETTHTYRLSPSGNTQSYVRHLLALGARQQVLHDLAGRSDWDIAVLDSAKLADVAFALADLEPPSPDELRHWLLTTVSQLIAPAWEQLDAWYTGIWLTCRPELAFRRKCIQLGHRLPSSEAQFFSRLARAHGTAATHLGVTRRVDAQLPVAEVTTQLTSLLAAAGI